MAGRGIALFVLLTAFTAGANAKEIYKVVGPDGKITFSDKPPADAATAEKYAIKDGPSTPVSAPNSASGSTLGGANAAAPSMSNSAAMRKAQAKQAIRGTSPEVSNGPGATQPSQVDPAIEKAVIGVLGYEDLVTQTEQLCLRALPTSFGKYSSATDGWRNRNASIVGQARKALSNNFSSAEQQMIQTGLRAKNANSLAQVAAAPTASQIRWCDSSSNEIKNGGMDAFTKPNLSGPLAKM